MLGYGCGVSRYYQFYDRALYKYQVLPRTHLESFEDDNVENLIKEKWVLNLESQVENFV